MSVEHAWFFTPTEKTTDSLQHFSLSLFWTSLLTVFNAEKFHYYIFHLISKGNAKF